MSWKKPFVNTPTSGSGFTNAGKNIILNCIPSINCGAGDAKRENNGASRRMIRVEKDDGANFRAINDIPTEQVWPSKLISNWKKWKSISKKRQVTACYPQIELFLSVYTEFYAWYPLISAINKRILCLPLFSRIFKTPQGGRIFATCGLKLYQQ